MQRVANCILRVDDSVLMLKKPRRGWYVAPGGKMEDGENIKDSAVREFKEETGLSIDNPELRGSFTFIMREGEKTAQEWMMFTFYSTSYSGDLLEVSEEGELEWVPVDEVLQKPMAEGDREIFKHILSSEEQVYGTFVYTTDFRLIDQDLDPSRPD
ncbi:8-oxo-dGTP diphosphatase [Halobacillus karajensis]|uniref:8-oxo-dGTP diphosphatase n=1 Tax=Halobacillus karajensis TaxID=195088 RepID=A0A059NWE7_9BACI|nr:8-oxo-dGTP diphosphatase [Halobacillus karajensis]CDQ19263.1 8-oxo-dGTP diphosphatase [Halobacillus karajensis]CDQ22663.1 8-oxo-dGTP diphosphatase [Halobacillus karajensis]CDQ26145.1 8-oxo-dGTP diphosphatase [Halobacillus karajensis]SEH39213.1 8-oxo-dGTP diphosphatase [Halobacillus karajensis]